MTEKPIYTEIATTRDGRDVTRGWVDRLALLPPYDPIQRLHGGGLLVYEEVLRDDQVKTCLQQRQLAVTSKPWEVTPGEESRSGKKAADLLRETLARIDFDAITEQMLYGVFYGYSVAECIWQADGNTTTLARLAVRDRRRFAFGVENELRLLTFASPMGERLPERKFWHFSTGASHGDEPYGLGMAYWLYWPALFKRGGVQLWLKFLDKFGVPTAVGHFSEHGSTDEGRQRLLQALQAIQTDSGIILPEGMSVDLIEATRGGTAGYDDLYDKMDEAISKLIVGQTMTVKDGASRSQAQVHFNVRQDLVNADADLVCNSFNRTVATWLTEYNFPGVKPPTVRRVMEEPDDALKKSEQDRNIAATGRRRTLADLTQSYGGEWEEFQSGSPALPQTADPPAPSRPQVAFADPFADSFPDQTALDAALDGLAPKLLQEQASAILQPVLALIQSDPMGAMDRLAQSYPQMDDAALEKMLARILFVAEVWGRLHGE